MHPFLRLCRLKLYRLPLACCALVAATAAHGEVYKWADEYGVMHYASAPPDKAKAAFKRLNREALAVPLARVSQREAPQPPAAQDLSGKVDALERQVEAERQARLAAEAQNQATQALVDQQAARNVAYIPTIPAVSGLVLLPTGQKVHSERCHSMAAGAPIACTQGEHWSRTVRDRSH